MKEDLTAGEPFENDSEQVEGRLQFYLCYTLDCIMEKGIRSCFECDDFPCSKLRPFSKSSK
ncbi:MAG: hypothetical protein A4E55_01853 [Pelotomaculum sp. PtaU1.Bin035]|nr:MAG: hypothetical protein A4E55_01853 [Pelotomaculum sp. PtaU1.Bin035]